MHSKSKKSLFRLSTVDILSLRYNPLLPPKHQMGPVAAFAVWAGITLTGVGYALSVRFGRVDSAATLATFSIYLAAAVFFANADVLQFVRSRFGAAAGSLLGACAFLAYLIFVCGTGVFTFARVATVLAFIFVPLALAATAQRSSPGAWQDYVTVAAVWTAVKFSPMHELWPTPGGIRFAYILTVLLCVTVAVTAFLLVRQFDRVGYNIGWGPRWSVYVFGSFLVFATIAIPLATAMHFVEFDPHWRELRVLPLMSLAILCFTAWPEEFLFRGLLQNMLQRTTKSETSGWVLASILFGFSHITNMGFPNWRYVILASIAGMFYGWTWRKTNSIFASAIVHALVDALWHFLFRTV
jgi:membrane protease YdiL (CAAX protease family)